MKRTKHTPTPAALSAERPIARVSECKTTSFFAGPFHQINPPMTPPHTSKERKKEKKGTTQPGPRGRTNNTNEMGMDRQRCLSDNAADRKSNHM